MLNEGRKRKYVGLRAAREATRPAFRFSTRRPPSSGRTLSFTPAIFLPATTIRWNGSIGQTQEVGGALSRQTTTMVSYRRDCPPVCTRERGACSTRLKDCTRGAGWAAANDERVELRDCGLSWYSQAYETDQRDGVRRYRLCCRFIRTSSPFRS